jgi:pilus assembly protein CpaC
VISGQQAAFNSGGQIPVPTPQSLGTTTFEWKNYGTMVHVIPIVLGNGKIRMDVRPEISALDEAHSVTVSGTTVPGILTRNTQTTVEMQAGQTLAIAGLVQYYSEATKSGLPWLSEVPYIGVLFGSTHNMTNQIELLITVTPELVDPLDASEVPPCGPGTMTTDPSDIELFFKGHLEVPKCCPNGNAAGNCGQRNGSQNAAPPDGMILGPPETVPSPAPSSSAGRWSTSRNSQAVARQTTPNNRYTPSKPDNLPNSTSAAAQNEPPSLIGPAGYDVVK